MTEDYTKRKIIYYSLAIFFDDGINITMENIAKDLGISKKTLYKYFKNKADLLNSVIDEFINSISELIENTLKSNPDSFVAICDFFSKFANTFAVKLNRKFFSDLQKKEPEIWKKINDFRIKKFNYYIPLILKEGIKNKYIRDGINPDIILLMYIASIQNILNPDVLSVSYFSAKEAVEQILTTLFYGICTEKGKKKFRLHFKKIKEKINEI